MDRTEILEVFKSTDSILQGHFQLTSGLHSETYVQCAKLFIYPKKAKTLCQELAKKLDGLKADFVLSPAVGGIIMGYQMAEILDIGNLFYERKDGEMQLRRGFNMPKGSKVIVVEDVVTTGGSVKEVIAEAEKAGAEVLAVASLVDRSNGKADFGKKFVSLLQLEVKTYTQEECTKCKEGISVDKPGSRNLK